MPNNSFPHTITTTVILDKTILDEDVNDNALIKYSKLNSGAINSDLVPDAPNTRTFGGLTKTWAWGYFLRIYASWLARSIKPNVDNSYNIGDVGYNIKEIHVNAIKGTAKSQILVNGLLGGLI